MFKSRRAEKHVQKKKIQEKSNHQKLCYGIVNAGISKLRYQIKAAGL
jgi:hypothetical protein